MKGVCTVKGASGDGDRCVQPIESSKEASSKSEAQQYRLLSPFQELICSEEWSRRRWSLTFALFTEGPSRGSPPSGAAKLAGRPRMVENGRDREMRSQRP